MSDRTTSLPVGAKRRFLWLAALLAGINLGGLWIAHGFEPVTINLDAEPFADLPTELGEWRGEPVQTDPEISEAVGACESLNRVYRNRLGTAVTLHAGRWDTLESWTPHHPQHCYASAGWQLEEREAVSLSVAGRESCQVQRLAFAREGQKLHVLFWFQLGGSIYTERDGARDALRAHWGRKEWPPIEKFMLQAGVTTSPEATDATLKEIAADILTWKMSAAADSRLPQE